MSELIYFFRVFFLDFSAAKRRIKYKSLRKDIYPNTSKILENKYLNSGNQDNNRSDVSPPRRKNNYQPDKPLRILYFETQNQQSNLYPNIQVPLAENNSPQYHIYRPKAQRPGPDYRPPNLGP